MSGFHAALGGTLMLNDWLAFRGDIPVVRYGYTFGGRPAAATYTSASGDLLRTDGQRRPFHPLAASGVARVRGTH